MTAPGFPRTQRIGILVVDDFEPLDVWGFTEAFAISRFIGTGYDSPPPYPFEVQAFAWVTGFGPRVLWDNVARWVDAGHYVTSAGVSAGTDMAFHLVSRLAGRAVAEAAASGAEYDWHRDPNQPIFYPQQAAVPTST